MQYDWGAYKKGLSISPLPLKICFFRGNMLIFIEKWERIRTSYFTLD